MQGKSFLHAGQVIPGRIPDILRVSTIVLCDFSGVTKNEIYYQSTCKYGGPFGVEKKLSPPRQIWHQLRYSAQVLILMSIISSQADTVCPCPNKKWTELPFLVCTCSSNKYIAIVFNMCNTNDYACD